MKMQINFDMYLQLCKGIAENIATKHKDKNVEIVAIMRGGMMPAQIIAKELGVKCGVIIPSLCFYMKVHDDSKTLIFVDDITDRGRTYNEVMKICSLGKVKAEYATVVLDGESPVTPTYYGIKTNNWVVMPHEDPNRVIEGDKGLFREGTNRY